MVQSHPYRRDVESGRFPINFVGMADQYHTFRVSTRGKTSMDTLMLKGKIANWLLERTRGQSHMGNGFGASKHHPKNFPFENPEGADVFVLFDNLVDVARFEDEFGITPPPATWSEAFAAARVAAR